jgi:hypothetical protein
MGSCLRGFFAFCRQWWGDGESYGEESELIGQTLTRIDAESCPESHRHESLQKDWELFLTAASLLTTARQTWKINNRPWPYFPNNFIGLSCRHFFRIQVSGWNSHSFEGEASTP